MAKVAGVLCHRGVLLILAAPLARPAILVAGKGRASEGNVFSLPEHEVLMVSYCGQSMSVVHRPSCGVRRQQLL